MAQPSEIKVRAIPQYSTDGGLTWKSWECIDTLTTDVFPVSELQRIVDLNNLWGNYKAETEKELLDQLHLIEEEYIELSDAYDKSDTKEMLDACGDTIVCVVGMIHRLGYNPDEVMDVINKSNESKIVDPESYEDVKASIDKYRDDDRYCNVFVSPGGVVRGTVVATGANKVLKSINYQEPDWAQLDEGLV